MLPLVFSLLNSMLLLISQILEMLHRTEGPDVKGILKKY